MIVDDKILDESLFDLVELSMKYIIGQIKVAFEISGTSTQRNEIFEYPIPAIRELLLNSILHRDYTSPTDIQIKIFDNKITFFNPGKLFGDITIDDLSTDYYQASTRNKLIAEAFYLTRDIEKYGSGFVRIRNEIASYPSMSFTYREVGDGFYTELRYLNQKTTTEKVVKKVVEKLSDNQIKILNLLRLDSRIQ